MPSPESVVARQALQKERVVPSISLADERASWNAHAMKLPLTASVTLKVDKLAGVTCAILNPPNSGANPSILYAHGGGLTTGSIITHRAFASELAERTGCTIVLPEFRLLPENSPSAPSDDLVAVYLALLDDFGGSKQSIFLGGDSSGAGLTITAMRKLRDQGELLPSGCFSISGAFDATLSGKSILDRQHNDPILSEAVLRHWQSHFGKDFKFDDPQISPLLADLSGMAPTLLMVGEDEVWFDDSVRMHRKLKETGSVSDLKIFDGMWHVWPMTSGLPETEQAFQLITDFIQRNS